MDPMACLGRQAIELEALLPEKVLGLLHLAPGHLDVANRPLIPVLRIGGYAVVFRPHQRIGADDDVRQIRRRFRPFAMHDEVFAVLDGLRHVGVGMHPSGIGMKRLAVMHLLVERNARIGAEVQQAAARRAVFAGHDVAELVAGRGRAGVEQALDVNAPFVGSSKGKAIAKSFVAGDVGERIGDAGDDVEIILAVEYRRNAAFPDLQEWIRTTRGDFQSFEFEPRVGRQGNIRILDRSGHLNVHRNDHFDVRIDVLDHAVGPLGIIDQVDVVEDQSFGGRRHVALAGEVLAAELRRVDDQSQVAVVPIRRFFVLGVGMGMDLFAVRALVEIELEAGLPPPSL